MSGQTLQLTGRQLDYSTAVRAGFPQRPQPGQAIKDAQGHIWIWPHKQGDGLSDLGQWVEAIGLGVSFISKLFGGGGPKPDNAARQLLQQQQGQIVGLQEQISSMSFFDKKTIFIVAILGLAAVFAFKR